MLIAVIEPDRVLARALQRELGARGCKSVLVHDFADAEALLRAGPVLAAVYVAARVPPLAGSDLLSELERAQLADVPTVAVVPDPGSLLAIALARGGVATVTSPIDAAVLAALLVKHAATGHDYDWRASMLGWARYLRARTHANRQRAASSCAHALRLARDAQRIARRRNRVTPASLRAT
ncbi:MAG TPA: hypothetical protein VHB97_06825 [Polyangia bacterium]|nr:hypothetical protein [Polyangia bacterium]